MAQHIWIKIFNFNWKEISTNFNFAEVYNCYNWNNKFKYINMINPYWDTFFEWHILNWLIQELSQIDLNNEDMILNFKNARSVLFIWD